MSTSPIPSALAATLFGRTRRAVLALLFGHAGRSFYLRQIARASGSSAGAVRREAERLVAAGILLREVSGVQVYYRANPECPVFRELKGLILKTAGAAEVLRAALAPLAPRIAAAFIYGSTARREEREGSDVDLLVVGSVRFEEVVAALGPAQRALAREVNPTVYPPAEFRAKLRAGHHFLSSLMRQEKWMLLGDERELARLGAKRPAHRASKQPRGNSQSSRARRPRPA
jgi:predicted nucleotidyltransferase